MFNYAQVPTTDAPLLGFKSVLVVNTQTKQNQSLILISVIKIHFWEPLLSYWQNLQLWGVPHPGKLKKQQWFMGHNQDLQCWCYDPAESNIPIHYAGMWAHNMRHTWLTEVWFHLKTFLLAGSLSTASSLFKMRVRRDNKCKTLIDAKANMRWCEKKHPFAGNAVELTANSSGLKLRMCWH